EQREWLNGLFAGLLSLEAGAAIPLASAETAALMPAAAGDDADDFEAPWHDQSLPLAERMRLAEGRPLRQRMMAAMGQQDCGQGGSPCRDYSPAIFTGKEEKLNLCVPGGKETTRTLRTLHELRDQTPPSPTPAEPTAPAAPAVVAAAGA